MNPFLIALALSPFHHNVRESARKHSLIHAKVQAPAPVKPTGSGGYEPVTVAPTEADCEVAVSTSVKKLTVGSSAPKTTNRVLRADIKFVKPLTPGMFVTFWTLPFEGSWNNEGKSLQIGSFSDPIPGISPTLSSYDQDQNWYNSHSSRMGKIKILTKTSILHMSFGLVPLSKKYRHPRAFLFHFIVRDSGYDKILDSGSKIISLHRKSK
jgi:hypothetical protein